MDDRSARLPELPDRLERAALVDAARLVGDLAAARTPPRAGAR